MEFLKNYMIRVPIQSKNLLNLLDDIEKNLYKLKNNSVFCEQLLIASPSLYDTLVNKNFNELSTKKKRNFINSIVSYINRAVTRTTPFGLFSAINVSNIDEKNDKFNNTSFYKNVRLDIEFIMNLVHQIEKNNYKLLRYRKNNATYNIGDRVFLPYSTKNKDERISINRSKPVQLIFDLFKSEKEIHFNKLLGALLKEYPDKNPNIIENYLSQIIEKEFLISTLRPPLTNTNELKWLIEELEKEENFKDIVESLTKIQDKITEYCLTEIGLGSELYLEIIKNLSKLVDKKPKSYLQVDTYFTANESVLSYSDIDDLEAFLDFIISLHSSNKINYLEEYKNRFLERYGEYIEVPLYELLDESLGIGAPNTYTKPQNKYIKNDVMNDENILEKNYFISKYIEAVKMKKDIVIDDFFVFFKKDKKEIKYPIGLELNFNIKTLNGQNQYYLGPNIGSNKAGKSFGRFSYINDDVKNVIATIEKEYINRSQESIYNISYLPQNIRSANVTRDYSILENSISINTNAFSVKQELSLDDILIGVESNRFFIRNRITNEKISVMSNNMLNPSIADNGIRLLQEISLQDDLYWSNFPWNKYYMNFSYIPKIKYKNIVIEPETWKINKVNLKLNGNKLTLANFMSAFKNYSDLMKIPNEFYLQSADNRILIDLNNDVYDEVLFKKFKQLDEIIICGKEERENLKVGNDNKPVEVVIPFINFSCKEKNNDKYNRPVNKLNSESLYLPLEEWIYYKIYTPKQNEEELIKYLEYICDKSKDYIDKYYFIRYSDPLPHIRFRIKYKNNKLNEIIKEFNKIMNKLIINKTVKDYSIETYIPENERYGNKNLMCLAESLFQIDSEVVFAMLKSDLKVEKLGVLSVLHYLNSFGISYDNQIRLLSNSVSHNKYIDEYQKFKNEFQEELDSYNDWAKFASISLENRDLIATLNNRKKPINNFIEKLINDENIQNSEDDIIMSIIHLHCNRFLGTNRLLEEKIYFYALKVLHSQQFKRKMLMTIE
ncbi:lantibiotic dehydratase [Macrococcus epidermidis]|uniref:lantibiotic dehydratase n=1 Tax=Macrococcus epidermidis TaxID=1902580 RepID=UPI0020B797E9|nr:lantibiotic dehydratase [Macrococcus epidermidis]UTH16272.1 lantibiotic dehydratase [Macrococcus epidermidis]